MSDVQQQVQDAIDELVSSGTERGVQVAAYKDGELVVDAVAGVADPATGREVTSGTPFYSYSVGKASTSTVVHQLVERGVFGYDTPLVELWPEFGAHGKERVTVRHVLGHTAGVPQIPQDTTIEDLCDWAKMCAIVADLELWWEPGTKVGYHAMTFGYLAGEIVRRSTGKRISEVLREDVAEPLGAADELYFGMPESEQHRLAVLENAPGTAEMAAAMPADLPMFKANPKHLWPDATFGNRSDVLAADIPAGGKQSARAIAKLYASLIGEVDGVRLLPEQRLREALTPTGVGTDEVFGMPTNWALGFSLGHLMSGALNKDTSFGVGGAGGTHAGADTATGIVFALNKNVISPDFATVDKIGTIVIEGLS